MSKLFKKITFKQKNPSLSIREGGLCLLGYSLQIRKLLIAFYWYNECNGGMLNARLGRDHLLHYNFY